MKKSTVSILALSAFLLASAALQSCASRETTYTTTEPYGEPVASTTTTTYTTTESDHDSVVGSTAHAAGTIIAAPFRIVGDALSVIF
jgi:ABC-type oligopeptide transport system substrate-binding subunit